VEIAALIVLAIAIAVAYFKLRSRVRRREAAVNIVLAKATFLSLPHDDRVKVHDKAVSDLNSMMGGRFKGFNGEYDQFGAYAHAMANLGISPVIKDYSYPRWYLVNNPFFDILPNDPLIEETAKEVKRKHGVNVSVSKEHRLLDKIRKAREEADQPKTERDALQENPIKDSGINVSVTFPPPRRERTALDAFNEAAEPLLVSAYRAIAAKLGTAPTSKTSDAEIVQIYRKVGTAFRAVSEERGERLPAGHLNAIVFKFYQVREQLGNSFLDEHLAYELKKYRAEGLREEYKVDMKLF